MNNTKQKPTNQKESTLNPEIKEKAQELFDLIEEQFIKDNKTCKTGEDISEEMGELLRSHRGMKELRFAYLIARTKSQEAEYGFEESTRYMKDKTLSELRKMARYSLEIIEVIEGDRPSNHLRHRIIDLKEIAPKVQRLATGEFEVRAKAYRNEITELQEAS
jgi:hypothetical protein